MNNEYEQQQEEYFTFRSHGLEPDTFSVLRFRGTEKLMECYEYEILLASEDPEISFEQVLGNPATLTIHNHDGSVAQKIHGVPSNFEQQRQMAGLTLYIITIHPKLYWLTLNHKNQIFLNKTLPDIFHELLIDGGLNETEFEFRLQRHYPEIDYICQFRETHLYFMTHWMERTGMYFFFQQAPEGEKVIITDTRMAHSPFRDNAVLPYVEPSMMGGEHRGQSIQAFLCRQQIIPGKVRVRDYNYEKQQVSVDSDDKTVKSDQPGMMYFYGDHVKTPEEASQMADTRTEEYRCRERIYHGESTIPGIMPGTLFTLSSHYRSGFNQEYQVLEISHEGSQESFLTAGVDEMLGREEQKPFYRNSFSSIEGVQQFRPLRTIEPSKFYGTLHAKIDAEGNGKYAELDDQGRYKVVLPFDLNEPFENLNHEDRKAHGKASAWIRMMQPYAGTNQGMHFPLHKGTEVLLTFIDGDPNRPVIAGALPNPEAASPVNSDNATMSKIVSASGNVIHMEDQEGKERILLHSPKAESWIRIGESNDPPPEYVINDNTPPSTGIKIHTSGDINIQAEKDLNFTVTGKSNFTCYNSQLIDIKQGQTNKISGGQTNKVHGDLKTLAYDDHITEVDNNKETSVKENNTIFVGGTYHEIIGYFPKLINDALTPWEMEDEYKDGKTWEEIGKGFGYAAYDSIPIAGPVMGLMPVPHNGSKRTVCANNTLIASTNTDILLTNSLFGLMNSTMSVTWSNTHAFEWGIWGMIKNIKAWATDTAINKEDATLEKLSCSSTKIAFAATDNQIKDITAYLTNIYERLSAIEEHA